VQYIVGIVVLLLIFGVLGKLFGKILEFILGLAVLAGIVFALISFGPAILAFIISIFSVIWPFLLFGFIGLMALGILMSLFENLKSAFKRYPWQLTILIIVLCLSTVIIVVFSLK